MELYAEHAAPLAVRSAELAVKAAKISASEISHLISVSCTGFEAPGIDVQLIDRLGLPGTVERVHVGFMGCHGAINGMRVALGLTAADRKANVLLVATELCSLHFCFSWEPERLVGNALFADGSAAMVCKASSNEGNHENKWRVAATGSRLFDNSRDAITWRIGDFGFNMSLSSEVPDLIRANLRTWLDEWLNKHGLTVTDIGSWAIHPGGPRIIDAVEESLDLLPESTSVSREILQTHGNMSSPTVLFIMEKLRRNASNLPCVALGFGPGLTAEAALIR
jgi:prepilin-type processing-associated H-X9-DG protein